MSAGNNNPSDKTLEQIADQLCRTINGEFNLTIVTESNNLTIQKLTMLINFVLDTARRNIAFNESILNAAGEGIYGIDKNGNTTFVNTLACNILGYDDKELLNKPIHNLILSNQQHNGEFLLNKSSILKTLHTGKAYTVDNEVFWHKSGKAIPVRYTSTPLIEHHGITGAVVTFFDITFERKTQQYINAISDIQELYIQGKSITTIFNSILHSLLDFTDSEYGFIGAVLHDSLQNPYLKTYAITDIAWDDNTRRLYEESIDNGIEFHNLDTLFGYTLKTGIPVISNNPNKDPRSGGMPFGHPPLNSYLGIPIFGSTGMIAMIGLANKVSGYNEETLKQLTPMTNAISSIIESSNNLSVIKDMAQFDQLTRVYNRAYFEHEIKHILDIHQHNQHRFALLLLDLNRFKDINDRLGHHAGDELLKAYCKRLNNCIKQDDLLCRVGGDEFVIISKNIKHDTSADSLAERIINLSNQPFNIDGQTVSCTTSIGIACFPNSGDNYSDLMKHADFALYTAKKNRGYQHYSDSLERAFMDRLILSEGLPIALQEKQLYVMFQPQVSLKDESISGFEVLLRWRHEHRGLISPAEFIRLAEHNNIADAINIYVVELTLKHLHQLNVTSEQHFKVAINISPCVHNIEAHMQQLLVLIETSGVNLKCFSIEFEITESQFIQQDDSNESELLHVIKRFNRHGIQFAIDDFGVKYSSINRFLEFKFNTIKIDLSFTQKLDQADNQTAIAIIETLIDLADKLDFDVVAEGVETAKQADILKSLGCGYAQGYFYYKPLLLHEIKALLKNQTPN